jgi:hypothetical protein
VALLLALHRALRRSDRRQPGITQYRSIEEAEADRADRVSD